MCTQTYVTAGFQTPDRFVSRTTGLPVRCICMKSKSGSIKRARASAGWLSTSCAWSTVLRVLSAEAKDRNEAAKHNLGTRLVSKSRRARPNQRQRESLSVSDPRCMALVTWVSLARLPCLFRPYYLCLYTSVNRTTSFHVVRATGCLFGEFVNRSTSFQDAQPAFKLFGLFSNQFG